MLVYRGEMIKTVLFSKYVWTQLYVGTLLLVTGLSKTAVAPEPNVYLIS